MYLPIGKKNYCCFLRLFKSIRYYIHKNLINSLPDFGIDNESFEWFSSYFENIEHIKYVLTNDYNMSNECSINCVVPLGSVLGPIF